MATCFKLKALIVFYDEKMEIKNKKVLYVFFKLQW